MSRIKDSSVEAVKQAADFAAVVEAHTHLRKGSGGQLMGRCPFHEERTPSFSVNPVKQMYFCFGCGAKGDLIGFVREAEGLDFVGAVEWLAGRFNVTLEYEESSPEQDAVRRRRDRLLELLDAAASFYQRYLWESPAGSLARDYLAGRGLGEDICREFRLGLALGGQTLTRKALDRGFLRQELEDAGLVNQRGNDYFQRRLLFPLADARGRVLGFQARKLHEDDPLPPKYVNTRETSLFRKGAILYGLDRARTAIAKEDRACVVEGNTDVLALRQAGFQPVVASMGTALTEEQLRELKRLTLRIWLCFDGDKAGEAATLRGMELAAGLGFEVKVVSLPPGLDPADAPEQFGARLASAAPYVVHRVRLELQQAPDRQDAFRRVRDVLARFEDSPDRQDALQLVADRLDLPRETLARLAPATRTVGRGEDLTPRILDAGVRLERDVLAAVLTHPKLREMLHEITPEHFDVEAHRALRAHLADGAPLDGDGGSLLAELDARSAAAAIDERTGTELLFRLRMRQLRRELQTADLERTKELQDALQKIQHAVAGLA